MPTNKLKLLMALAALAVSGCATTPAPRASLGAAPPSRLITSAAAFEAYTRRTSAIDATFASQDEIGAGLRTAAGYEPRQLESGMVAYAALAALQEPAFAAAVRKQGRAAAARIAADPDAAMDLPGASAAAARANAAIARRGEALAGAGARVKAASYSIQRQSAWSRARLTNPAPRLAAVKQAASYRPDPADRARVLAATSEAGRRGPPGAVAARGVAVAALTLSGQASAAERLLSEPRTGGCLREAKLNYHQCLAAAGTPYEDIYCLGVHAMSDPGRCIVSATKPIRRAGL